MLIRVDATSPTPVFQQIVDEVKSAIARGACAPHEAVPSVRQMAAQSRLAKSTVHRIWQALGVQPHRQRSCKLSNDPFFVEKVRDIVGPYLQPAGQGGGAGCG